MWGRVWCVWGVRLVCSVHGVWCLCISCICVCSVSGG